jgi:hypothetical protein
LVIFAVTVVVTDTEAVVALGAVADTTTLLGEGELAVECELAKATADKPPTTIIVTRRMTDGFKNLKAPLDQVLMVEPVIVMVGPVIMISGSGSPRINAVEFIGTKYPNAGGWFATVHTAFAQDGAVEFASGYLMLIV